MQEFNTFDIIIISITVLLGLRGLLKGFIKEAFGLIGIIGGLFVASRFAEFVGNQVAVVLAIQNDSAKLLIGFIIALVGFWILVYILGMIVSKLTAMSGLGVVDRAIGFIFGGAKIFLIFSVVAYLAVQVKAFKNIINEKDVIKNSSTFPVLIETGSFIFKLDTSKFLPNDTADEKEETKAPIISKEVKEEMNKMTETVSETTTKIVEAVKEEASEMVKDTVIQELSTKEKE